MRQIQRSLAAKLHNDANNSTTARAIINAAAVKALNTVQRVFKRERFKEKQIAGVKIRANGFRIGVNHDAFKTHFRARERSLAAAIIKFNSLTNTIWSAAKNDDLGLGGDSYFVIKHALAVVRERALVCGIKIWSGGVKFCGARVYQFVDGLNTGLLAVCAHFQNCVGGDGAQIQVGKLRVGVTMRLGLKQNLVGQLVKRFIFAQHIFKGDKFRKLRDIPRVITGELANAFHAPRAFQGVTHVIQAPLTCDREFPNKSFFRDRPLNLAAISKITGGAALRRKPLVVSIKTKSVALHLHGANYFLQRFFKCAPNTHGLAHTFHLSGEAFVGLREFFKCPTRHFHHDIIKCWFKARAGVSHNIIAQFIKRVTNSKLGRNFGDWKTSRLAGKSAGATHARIHFNNNHVTVGRVDGELHIAAASFNSHRTHNAERRVAHALIFLITQRHDWRNGDAVAGVHTHGIQVFNSAHNDAVVLAISHHFKFIFFPA